MTVSANLRKTSTNKCSHSEKQLGVRDNGTQLALRRADFNTLAAHMTGGNLHTRGFVSVLKTAKFLLTCMDPLMLSDF